MRELAFSGIGLRKDLVNARAVDPELVKQVERRIDHSLPCLRGGSHRFVLSGTPSIHKLYFKSELPDCNLPCLVLFGTTIGSTNANEGQA
jgi:hypothetical protein